MKINRETLWEDTIITFKNPKFDARGTFRVRFAGEAGLDAGGLRIEYSTLLLACFALRLFILLEQMLLGD